MVYTLDDPSNK